MELYKNKNIKPMLISELKEPFNSNEFIYELKLDGSRCIAYIEDGAVDLRNKRNIKMLSKFPELKTISNYVKSNCILDGELLVLKSGIPEFYELQRRTIMTDHFKIELAAKKSPACFVAYDIIAYDNEQVTDMTLMDRKRLLNDLILDNKDLAISRYIDTYGIELFDLAKKQKLEGVVAKRKNSKYFFDKRTKDWIKFKFLTDEEFIVCGYIRKENNSVSLILGKYKDNELIYKGHVSSGVRSSFLNEYQFTQTDHSPFKLTPVNNEDAVWVKPKFVCVVEYMPNTKNALRQPVFKGIRTDIKPKDVKV